MYWQHRLGKDACGLVPVRVAVPETSAVRLSAEVMLAGATVRVQGISLSAVVVLVRGLSC